MLELLIVCVNDKPQYWSSHSNYSQLLVNCGYDPTVFCSEDEARAAIDITVAQAIKYNYNWAIVSGGKVTLHDLLTSEVHIVDIDIDAARQEYDKGNVTGRASGPERLRRWLLSKWREVKS